MSHEVQFLQGSAGRYVEIRGVFCFMPRIARLDWGGWGSVTCGKDWLGESPVLIMADADMLVTLTFL